MLYLEFRCIRRRKPYLTWETQVAFIVYTDTQRAWKQYNPRSTFFIYKNGDTVLAEQVCGVCYKVQARSSMPFCWLTACMEPLPMTTAVKEEALLPSDSQGEKKTPEVFGNIQRGSVSKNHSYLFFIFPSTSLTESEFLHGRKTPQCRLS